VIGVELFAVWLNFSRPDDRHSGRSSSENVVVCLPPVEEVCQPFDSRDGGSKEGGYSARNRTGKASGT
jgi:hypothetical protein